VNLADLSENLQYVLADARERAARFVRAARTDDVLVAMLEMSHDQTRELLKQHADIDALWAARTWLPLGDEQTGATGQYSADVERVVERATAAVRLGGFDRKVTPTDVLGAMLFDKDCIAYRLLEHMQALPEDFLLEQQIATLEAVYTDDAEPESSGSKSHAKCRVPREGAVVVVDGRVFQVTKTVAKILQRAARAATACDDAPISFRMISANTPSRLKRA
jgi:hypothetical protein